MLLLQEKDTKSYYVRQAVSSPARLLSLGPLKNERHHKPYISHFQAQCYISCNLRPPKMATITQAIFAGRSWSLSLRPLFPPHEAHLISRPLLPLPLITGRRTPPLLLFAVSAPGAPAAVPGAASVMFLCVPLFVDLCSCYCYVCSHSEASLPLSAVIFFVRGGSWWRPGVPVRLAVSCSCCDFLVSKSCCCIM